MELSWPSSEGLFEKQLNNLPCSVFNTSKNVATTSRPIPAKKAVQEKPQCQPCRKKLPSKYYTKLYNKIWQEMEDMMEEEKRLSMMLDWQSYEQNSPRLRESQQSVSSCLIPSSQRCQDVNGGNGLNLKQNRCKGVPLDNRANQSVSSCLIQNRCKSVPLDNGKCCICKPVYCSCNPVKCTCKPGKIRDSGGNFAGEIRDSGENFAGEIRDNGENFAGEIRDSGGNFAGKIRDSGGNFAGEIRDSERNFAGEIRDSEGNFAASCSKEKKGEQKNVSEKQQRVRNRNRNYLKEGEEAGVLEENRKKDWLREGREDKKGEIAGKQQVLKNRDKDEEQEKRMEEEDKEEEEEEEYFWCGASLYVFVEEVDSRKRANTREMMAHKVKSNRRHINRMKEYLRMITGDPVELEEDEKGGEQEIEVEKIDVENWLKQVSPESQVDAWVSTVVAEDCLDCIFPLPQWKRYEWDSNDIDDSSDYEQENGVSGTQFRNSTFSENCSNKAQGSGGNDVVNSSTQGSDSENSKKIYGNIVGSSAQDNNLKSAQNFGGKDVINSSTQDKVSKDSRNPDGKDLINSSKQGSDSKSTQNFGGNDVVNSSVHVCCSKNSGGNNVINSILQDSESKRARNSCGKVVNPSKNGSNSKNSNSNVVEIHESSSTGSFYLEISCGEISTSDKNFVKNLKCSSSEGDCFSDNAQWLENSQNSSSIKPDVRGGNFRKKLDKICGNLRKSSENLGGRFCRSKVDAVDEDDTDSTNFEEKIEELTGNRISSCDSTENKGNSSHNNRALSGKHGDSVCKTAAGSRKPQRNDCDGTNKNVVTTNNNLVGNLQKNLVKNNKSLAVNLEKTGEAIPNLLVLKVGSQEAEKLKNVLVDNNFREINAQTISKTTENLRNSHDESFDNSFDMFLDSIDQLTENRQKSVEEKFVENSNEMSQEKYENHRNSVNENNVDKCNEIPMKKIEKSTQNHRNSVDEIFVDNSSGIVMKKIDKSKENSSEKYVEDNPNAKNMANTRKSFEKSSGNVEKSSKVGANFLGKNSGNSNEEVLKDSGRKVLKICGDSVGICGNPVRNCENSARNSVTVHQFEVANTQKTILTGESSGALFVDAPKLHKYRKIAKNEDFAVPCNSAKRSKYTKKSLKFSKGLGENGRGYNTRNCRKSEDIQRGITYRKRVKNSLNKNAENCRTPPREKEDYPQNKNVENSRTPQREKVGYPQNKNAENSRTPQREKVDHPQNKNAENSRTLQRVGVGSCKIIDGGEKSCETIGGGEKNCKSYEPVAGTSRGVDNFCKTIAESVKNCRTSAKNDKSTGGDVENCVTSEKNCKYTVENFKSFGHSVRNCVVILEKLEICLDSRIGNRTTRKVIEASCQNSDKKRKSCVLDENLCTNDENFVKKRCMASENDTSNGNQKLMENSGKNDLQHNPKKLLQSKSRLLVKNVSENLGDGFKDGQLKKKLRICIETPKIAGRKSLEEIEHEMKVFYGVLKDSNQKQVVCDNVKKSKQKQLISDIVEKSNEKQQKICDHSIKSDRKQLICDSVDETKKKQPISHSVDKSNQKQLNSDNAEKSNVKQHNICDHTKKSDKKQMTSDSVEKSNQKQLIVNRPGISGEDQLISGSKQDYSYSIPSITKHISTKIIIDNSLSITATSGDVKTNYIRLKNKLAADENDFSTKNPKSNLGADQTRRVKHPLSLTKRLRKSTSTLTNSNQQLINESNDSGLDVEIEIVKRKVKKMFGIITEIRPPLQDDNAKDAIVWNCGRCKKFYNYTQVKFKFPELNLVAQCPKKCRQANGTKHLKGQLMFEFLIENILDEKVYSYLLANNEAESFFGCSAFAYWSRDTVRVELRQCIERLLIGRQKGLISNFFVDENAFDEQGRQFIVNVVRMREKSSETN